ncbi:unnamed protein product [Arctia plantaginis]|uniref:Uncharacterized protein n=1 Tax=Arctia plantaginis TaxID=874455 RepID=A0A8S1ACL3_ARCPL|nr:unnamed protein product [Arctia plantaginis]
MQTIEYEYTAPLRSHYESLSQAGVRPRRRCRHRRTTIESRRKCNAPMNFALLSGPYIWIVYSGSSLAKATHGSRPYLTKRACSEIGRDLFPGQLRAFIAPAQGVRSATISAIIPATLNLNWEQCAERAPHLHCLESYADYV